MSVYKVTRIVSLICLIMLVTINTIYPNPKFNIPFISLSMLNVFFIIKEKQKKRDYQMNQNETLLPI